MNISNSFAAIAILVAGCVPSEQNPSPANAPASPAATVPESLRTLYPPVSPEPTYLFSMLRLDAAFTGIVVDLSENDPEGARTSYKAFQAAYAETARLVPEWADRYPAGPVEHLGRALDGPDRENVMAAVRQVGALCHSCHLSSMVPVQQKFRWGSFASIRPTDPVLARPTDLRTFKHSLSANLTGVTHNLRQGQLANARRQFQELGARFSELRSTCADCHGTRVGRFVGRDVQNLLEQAGEALSRDGVTADDLAPLLQRFGQESCSGCHLVHVPAAMAAGSSR